MSERLRKSRRPLLKIDHCPKCGEFLHDEMGHSCPAPSEPVGTPQCPTLWCLSNDRKFRRKANGITCTDPWHDEPSAPAQPSPDWAERAAKRIYADAAVVTITEEPLRFIRKVPTPERMAALLREEGSRK